MDLAGPSQNLLNVRGEAGLDSDEHTSTCLPARSDETLGSTQRCGRYDWKVLAPGMAAHVKLDPDSRLTSARVLKAVAQEEIGLLEEVSSG